MQGLVRYLDRIFYVLGGIYACYAWYTYSGLYRLFAEWQMETFGAYDLKVTFAVLLLALMIPGALAGHLLGKPERPGPPNRWSRLASSPAVAATLGVLAIGSAVAAGWIGYGKTQEKLEFEAVDLNAGQQPVSRHVIMTAIAQPDLALHLITKRSESTRTDAYVPLTSPTWRRGEPIVYFLKTAPELVEGKTVPFLTTTRPAVLLANGLPGPLLEIYRKHGIAVADPAIVIDSNPYAYTAVYFMVAFLAGFLGVGLLSAAINLAVRQRRGADVPGGSVRPH